MDTTQKEFAIGIIGCGRISQTYVAAIERCPGVRLTAVMDTRPEPALATAEEANCRPFTDLEGFGRESGVEGAIICSPPNTHRAAACALMEHGIHVLCEKPFAPRIEDALAMEETAEEASVLLMMASKFRYVEDIIRAKAMIASGMLGEIQFYENRFCSKVNMRGRWNADPRIAGGGVLIDNGTHSVDVVRYLIGPIRKVHACEGKRVMGLPVEDTASLSFITENRDLGAIFLSWSIQAEGGSYISIYGDEGSLRIGWQQSAVQLNGRSEWVQFGVGYDKIEAFKSQVVNFVETARHVARPITTLKDAIASVEVIEAAYRSIETDSWIIVEDNCQSSTLAVNRLPKARSA